MTAPALEAGQLVTPTGVFLGRWTPKDPQWHDARRIALGGSEIAAVLGLSPWESRFSLWHRKRGAVDEQPENEEMEWGKRLEPVVLGKYLDEHPECEVGPSGTFVHADRRWQLANPDALLSTDGPTRVWECKVSRDDIGWGEPGTDEIPINYLCQTRWYLDVLGLDEAVVSVLIAGQEYREYLIRANETDAATLRAAGAEFMRTIREDERPDIDAHSQTLRIVRELHPDIDPVDHELPADLAMAYRDALAAEKAADDAKSETVARVLDSMGRARKAMHIGEYLALRVPGRGDNPPFLRPSPALSKEIKS